jgi:hypothetical protein
MAPPKSKSSLKKSGSGGLFSGLLGEPELQCHTAEIWDAFNRLIVERSEQLIQNQIPKQSLEQ